jgi:hypothetical protein
MDRVGEMANEQARILLNRTIEAFLSEGSTRQRLAEANAYIRRLESYRDEIPDELHELNRVANILASSTEYLSPERELELTDRLLTLYVRVSDGALIF